jgi:hypothetical protein
MLSYNDAETLKLTEDTRQAMYVNVTQRRVCAIIVAVKK